MPDHQAVRTSAPARRYRGTITESDSWEHFQPRVGDVILATPAKSGTTWTQSMVAMLLHGTCDLPDILGVVSPWLDANFQPVEDVLAGLDKRPGRRVVKTHTPVDGLPVWEGVSLVVVFRHPLEVFLSIRKHLANMREADEANPLSAPFDQALDHFLQHPCMDDQIDSDSLAGIVRHFETAMLSDRWPQRLALNYAAMTRDHAGTLERLNACLGAGASAALLAEIQAATAFGAMKARARDFAPEAGADFWRDDSAFFASGQSGVWREAFSEPQITAYDARFAALLPNPAHRRWIETGHGDV